MAGTPKQSRLLATLAARATRELGEDASSLDYVTQYLRAGGMLSGLAEELAVEMQESISRPFVSNTAHGLADDAKERIAAARREGATALVEQSVAIADNAPETSGGVMKAKLQVITRQWMAEKNDPDHYGSRVEVAVSLGALHLDALRKRELSDNAQGSLLLPAVTPVLAND